MADYTLTQILGMLYEAHRTIDQLREQVQQLQTTCTDLKAQSEAKDALPPAVG